MKGLQLGEEVTRPHPEVCIFSTHIGEQQQAHSPGLCHFPFLRRRVWATDHVSSSKKELGWELHIFHTTKTTSPDIIKFHTNITRRFFCIFVYIIAVAVVHKLLVLVTFDLGLQYWTVVVSYAILTPQTV
jgi:hypothetical protein